MLPLRLKTGRKKARPIQAQCHSPRRRSALDKSQPCDRTDYAPEPTGPLPGGGPRRQPGAVPATPDSRKTSQGMERRRWLARNETCQGKQGERVAEEGQGK